MFVTAGVIYVGGAVGMEAIEGLIWKSSDGEGTFGLLAFTKLIEETAEMAGVVLLNYTLLPYISEQQGKISLLVSKRPNLSTTLDLSSMQHPPVEDFE